MLEIAYAISTAIAVLDKVRSRVGDGRMGGVLARITFFVNVRVRFAAVGLTESQSEKRAADPARGIRVTLGATGARSSLPA